MTTHEWCVRLRRAMERGGVASDDDRMTLRYVYSLLNTYRNTNIKYATDFGKESTLLKYVEQDYGVTPLCEVDKAENPLYKWGCTVKKVCKVPRFLSLPMNRAITYVGIIDRAMPFMYAEPTDIAVKRKTKIGAMFNYWYFRGNDVYVVPSSNLENIEVIDIRAVFADPSEVDDRINPDFDVEGYTIDYPMLSTTEDEVIRFAMQELGVTIQMPTDLQNNARDDT
jgi:hypothetical protein